MRRLISLRSPMYLLRLTWLRRLMCLRRLAWLRLARLRRLTWRLICSRRLICPWRLIWLWRLGLPRRLRLSRPIGGPRLAPAVAAASALVVKGLTQALQLVDQSRTLGADPVAIAVAAPSLRGAIEARVVVDVTHAYTLSATAAGGGAFATG
jgi:hypothetical protein